MPFLCVCDVHDVSQGHCVWNFLDVNNDLPVNDTHYVNDELNYIHIETSYSALLATEQKPDQKAECLEMPLQYM